MSASQIIPLGPPTFDYDKLTPQVAQDARHAASTIRAFQVRTVEGIIDTGNLLRSIKEKIGHGAFGQWIAAEFDMSSRTAQRYMQAAEWAKGKSDTVSHLEPKTLYLLAAPSTPTDVRNEVVAKLSAGEHLSRDRITKMVSERKAPANRQKEQRGRNKSAGHPPNREPAKTSTISMTETNPGKHANNMSPGEALAAERREPLDTERMNESSTTTEAERQQRERAPWERGMHSRKDNLVHDVTEMIDRSMQPPLRLMVAQEVLAHYQRDALPSTGC